MAFVKKEKTNNTKIQNNIDEAETNKARHVEISSYNPSKLNKDIIFCNTCLNVLQLRDITTSLLSEFHIFTVRLI